MNRDIIIKLVEEAVVSGARQQLACEEIGISVRTLQRWCKDGAPEADQRPLAKRPEPANKLTESECKAILEVVNKPDYQLRASVLNDIRVLARMNHELILDEGSRNPMSIEQLEQRMREWLEIQYKAVLFLHQVKVVGYCLYQEQRDDYSPKKIDVYVRQFYIERGDRGKGFGQKAFEKFCDEFLPYGSSITLDALESNPGGQAFWRKLGFKPYYIRFKFESDHGAGCG